MGSTICAYLQIELCKKEMGRKRGQAEVRQRESEGERADESEGRRKEG